MEHRLLVLADSSGRILAAYIPEKQERDALPHVALLAGHRQVVREVEIPEALRRDGFSGNSLSRYRLSVKADKGEIVPVDDRDRS
jgi:hypothetical protein